MVLTPSDEWQKFAHSLPNLYVAIKTDRNTTVRNFLQITDSKDTTCDQLGLSVRATNCLRQLQLPHNTLNELLDLPLLQLASMERAGAKTIQEILDAIVEYVKANPWSSSSLYSDLSDAVYMHSNECFLTRFSDLILQERWDDIEAQLESDSEIETLLKMMDIADTIGADMVAAMLTTSFPMAFLFPALCEYIHEQRVLENRVNEIRELVDGLSEARKTLPVKPFATAWPKGSSLEGLYSEIDDDVVFTEIPAIVTELSDKVYQNMKPFLVWCRTDIACAVSDIVAACFKNDRQREVTTLRAEGKTLEEIGSIYNLTRERVRQIEKKCVMALPVKRAEDVVSLISAVRGGDEILTTAEIMESCGKEGTVFLHLLRNTDKPKHFRYAKPLDAFIVGNPHLEEEHVQSFVDELPDRIASSAIKGFLERASERGLPEELIELQIRADYNYVESIQTWQRGKLSIRKMCREVLPEYDPDGIHVTVPEELQQFRERLYQRFGTEVRVSESDHALMSIIAELGMLRDRGTYVASREHILPDELLRRIREYVDQGENDVYMFSTLFEAFKPELLQAGVDNRYFLQGVLKNEWNQFYSFSRDCISRSGRTTNIYGTVETFIKNTGRYVQVSEIKEAFPGVTDAVLNFALTQKRIIACNGKYIHADNLKLTGQHIQLLRETLDALLADGQVHHSRELFSLANTYESNWLDELGVTFQSALFSIAAFLFNDEYVFARPWIARKGSEGETAICTLRGQPIEGDEKEEESYSEPVLIYEGKLIDSVILVLQKTASEMTVKEITDHIIQDGLYSFSSSNPPLIVYQAINNAMLGKGKRSAALGRLIGTRTNEQGRKLYYLFDANQPVFIEPEEQNSCDEMLVQQTSEPIIDAETASRWNQLLSEEFEDGLRLNGMRLRKFRNLYEERYHDTVEPDDDKLILILKQVGDYRDDRIYARQDAKQASLMEAIREDVLQTLSAGASCVYPQQLFEKYRILLGQQLSVYTLEAFKALLSASPNRQFSFSYGIICLPGKSANVNADVMNLFRNSYEPVTYSQMAERLWYIPLDRIKHELVTEPSIVNIEQETYFFASNFPISAHELAALQRVMHQRIEDEGFLVGRDLRELMLHYCPNAIMDTANWKDWGIRNVMAWLLRDHFDFNGVVISAKGSGMDTHQVFRSYCRSHDRVTVEELKDLCAQLDVSGIYWDSVMAEMVRISRNEFVSKRQIRFDTDITDRALETACPGEYMPLKDFTLFMSLPGVAVPWNGFLLESYLREFSRVFRLEQAGPTEHTPIGAMVRRTSHIHSNRDLLIDALAHDHTWNSTKEALDVLVERGYRTQRVMANATEIIKTAQTLRERLKASEK